MCFKINWNNWNKCVYLSFKRLIIRELLYCRV